MSSAVRAAVGAALEDGVGLSDLGAWRFRGLPEPIALFQVDAPDLNVGHDDARALAACAAREDVARRVADGRAAPQVRDIRHGQQRRLAAYAPAVRRLHDRTADESCERPRPVRVAVNRSL